MKKNQILAAAVIVFSVLLSSFAFYIYQILFTPNILLEQEDRLFPIYKGTTFKELQDRLYSEHVVNDLVSFSFLAKIKGYDEQIKPGMYQLTSNMSNVAALKLLISGNQTPVKLTFNNARKIEELAAKLTMNLQMDSLALAPYLQSDSVAEAYGFTKETFISMFLPNTYEVYWTATPKDLLDRMKKEYDRFWNETRINKAKKLGLSPVKVAIVASIVDAETNKMDEAPRISGVYLNRLNQGHKLQADPTLVFALGDFGIRRILHKDKEYDSPYNTYKYYGLPPGPINMPSIAALEAVLNTEDHEYLYFCAKEDFSGYHVFAKEYRDHINNANRFQKALDQQRIYR